MFQFSELLPFSYIHQDLQLLLALLAHKAVGRTTVAQLLFYLKKHELSSMNVRDVCSGIKKIKLKNKSAINSIQIETLEQQYCSLEKSLKSQAIQILPFWDPQYPQLLLQTDDFPLVLFVKGNADLLNYKAIAVVGTRRVTSYGVLVTEKLVSELVAYDFVIVSGCMYGVDAVAHEVTLDCSGRTVAVLGYGFNKTTPQRMSKLQSAILAQGGCLVTEYFPDISASKGTFPQRNRIVAGMCAAVVVIEAAQKSGTHITAECALQAGRDVFAIPGSIFNPYTLGTKYLLQEGAHLVTSGADIVAELQKVVTIPSSELNAGAVYDVDLVVEQLQLDDFSKKVVRELLFLPQETATLAKKLQCSIAELLTVLGMLELENIVVSEAGVWRTMILYSGHAK